jgi:hypothetical protein
MKINPTPAPWEARSAGLSDNTLVVGAGAEILAVVRPKAERNYSEEDYRAQANAVLMAASPAMLAFILRFRVASALEIEEMQVEVSDLLRRWEIE